MQVQQGIAVSPGVAIGEALVLDSEGFRIPRRFVVRDAVDVELARLDRAIGEAADEIRANRESVAGQLGGEYAAIFSAHLQMLEDRQLRRELETLIRERHYSPEYAVARTLGRYATVFRELEGGYLAERAHDIVDIEKNLLAKLLGTGREELSQLSSPVVVLAHDLTPSEVAMLDRQRVLGFVTEVGGAGGHAAIVARGLEIPAIVGAGRFLSGISGGDLVVVDGDQGRLILEPDPPTLERYHRVVEVRQSHAAELDELRDLPARTRDGVAIELLANIEFPAEARTCLARGAAGIGLYRTEFLYLGSRTEPSEEDHYRAYSEVLEVMGDRPVVIRTLDLGADKLGQLPRAEEERNPFLGLRSIRLSLRSLSVFRTQLRAILRASTVGAAKVMFPLIATLPELRQAKLVLAEVMEDMQEEGLPVGGPLPVGMMVEVPSAVAMLDRFLDEVDFISIGTNDLIQYALAVDRSNKEVADLYHAGDPAVLRLLDSAIKTAQQAGIPVSVCGQMCEQPAYVVLLLGLGLRGLSVPPGAVPEIKQICRSVSIADCQAVAARALELDHARAVDTFLKRELRRLAPQLVRS